MRFARGDMRDHIVLHKNDHGASYCRYRVAVAGSAKDQLLRDFRRCSIFDFRYTIQGIADLPVVRADFRF